jgi:hypothetical protein
MATASMTQHSSLVMTVGSGSTNTSFIMQSQKQKSYRIMVSGLWRGGGGETDEAEESNVDSFYITYNPLPFRCFLNSR